MLEWFANNTVVSNPGKFQICCLVDLKVAFASRKWRGRLESGKIVKLLRLNIGQCLILDAHISDTCKKTTNAKRNSLSIVIKSALDEQ